MENKIGHFVVGIFVAIAIFGLINSIVISKKKKIFTAAFVYKNSGPAKNGTTFYFKYFLNGQEFYGNTKRLFGGTTNYKNLLFIEVLKENLKSYHVLEFTKVPDCLSIEDIPPNGWSEIPKDLCK